MTAGLGVPSTLTWNGSSRTAPEMPAGVAMAETTKAAAQGHGLGPPSAEHAATVTGSGPSAIAR